MDASVSVKTAETAEMDDKRPSVSAPDGRPLTAKGERVRLPNTSPNFRARALSDVIMPQMAGPQLAKQPLTERPSVRVLFMSGFAQPILDSGGHLDPGTTLIEKPFFGPALLAKIAQILLRTG